MTTHRFEGIALVVSDLAGTLVDHGSLAPISALREGFARFGCALSAAEARAPMGQHKRDHIRNVLAQEAVRRRWHEAHASEPDEAVVERLFAAFVPIQLEVLPRHVDVLPGARILADALAAGDIPLAVTTGYNREMQDIVLASLAAAGIEPAFATGADRVAAGRPAPDIIHACMAACGIEDPGTVLTVGDTVVDIESARAAGCHGVAVVESGNQLGLSAAELAALAPEERAARVAQARDALLAAGADATIAEVGELPALLGLASTAGQARGTKRALECGRSIR